jgi:hypothetical protein
MKRSEMVKVLNALLNPYNDANTILHVLEEMGMRPPKQKESNPEAEEPSHPDYYGIHRWEPE